MKKPVEIRDLLDLQFFGGLKADNGRLIFVRAEIDQAKDAYRMNLMEYRNQKIIPLTSRDQVSSFDFVNADTICFLQPAQQEAADFKSDLHHDQPAGAAKGTEPAEPAQSLGATDVMELSLLGGEAVKTAVIPMKGALLLKRLKDGSLLLLHQDLLKNSCAPHPDYEVLDELPWYFNGEGFINKKRMHLYRFTPEDGALHQLALGYSFFCGDVHDDHVYFAGAPDDFTGEKCGVYDLNLCTDGLQTLLEVQQYRVDSVNYVNGELLCFAAKCDRYGLNENPQLYAFDLSKPHPKMSLACSWDENVENTIGTDCAVVPGNCVAVYHDKLYFTSTIVEHNTLFVYEKGAMHQVFSWPGSIHSFAFDKDTLYFIGAAPNELQQLYRVENDQAICLSHFNPIQDEWDVSNARPVFYTNYANQEQMGWVLFPRNFDPEKKYPAILDIHGGPKTVYGTIFYHEMQVWASHGYFVFFCNPFGADGQGNAYADLRDKYGTDDFTDLMNFTDQVLHEIPQIDPARVGVTGGSYGGFMTNWIVGHTNRFAAAATQRSISNWISFLGTSDIGPGFVRDQQGHGLENIPRLWEHSPLAYQKNFATPTLVIHSDEDYRCPLEQGMQMLTGLLEAGVPAKMVLFHGENHDLSRTGKPSHRLRRLKEITDWMDTYASDKKQ